MKAINIFEDLKGNAYPGRGIVIGQSEDGRQAVTRLCCRTPLW